MGCRICVGLWIFLVERVGVERGRFEKGVDGKGKMDGDSREDDKSLCFLITHKRISNRRVINSAWKLFITYIK